MKPRLLELLLLVLFLVGGTWAWTTGRERGRLQAEYDLLVRSIGDLPIGDPTKVHIRALPTGDPMHFAWRIYVPPNYRLVRRDSSGSSGTSHSTASAEFIARVRFREDQGSLFAYHHLHGGSSRSNFGDKSLANLLRDRWDKILVEELGGQRVETIDSNGSAVLLRLALPADMQAEARKMLSPYDNERFNPTLFSLELGPERPKPTSTPSGK